MYARFSQPWYGERVTTWSSIPFASTLSRHDTHVKCVLFQEIEDIVRSEKDK